MLLTCTLMMQLFCFVSKLQCSRDDHNIGHQHWSVVHASCVACTQAVLHAEKLVTRAHALLENYKENGVKADKILMRLPATWQGIQAAKQLESEGIAAHVTLVYRHSFHLSVHTFDLPVPLSSETNALHTLLSLLPA